MKKLLLLLLIIIIPILFLNYDFRTIVNGKEHILDISGETDPRLEIKYKVLYEPKGIQIGQGFEVEYTKECSNVKKFQYVDTHIIKNQEEYNLTIPFYSEKKINGCPYEFQGIAVDIFRVKDTTSLRNFSRIPILTKSISHNYIEKGTGEIEKDHFFGMGFFKKHIPKFINNKLVIDKKQKMKLPISRIKEKYFKLKSNQIVHCPSEEVKRTEDKFIRMDTSFVRFGCYMYKTQNKGIDTLDNNYTMILNILPDEEGSQYIFEDENISLEKYKKGLLSEQNESLFMSKQGKFSNLEETKWAIIKYMLNN